MKKRNKDLVLIESTLISHDSRLYDIENSLDRTGKDDLLEAAWGLLANAHGGDWDLASEASGWKKAAEKWRGEYHAQLSVCESSLEDGLGG